AILTILLSFAWAIWAISEDPAPAYFDPRARIWEFAAGGLLALLPIGRMLPSGARHALGWFGLAGILTCGVLLPATATFPGFAALWPVVAALCLLASGMGDTPSGASRVLAWKPLASLGEL